MKNFFIAVAAAAVAGILAGCASVPAEDYTLDPLDYETREEHAFPPELLVTEDDYINKMENYVEPYLEQRFEEGYLECTSGNSIHYETLKADESRGVVVIFHGFCEYTKKYNEISYYFLMQGYDVVRFEHHGLGLSTRSEKNLSKVTTHNFMYYVEDAHEIIENVAVPFAEGKPLYCYAHSMGGGIATYLMELYPDTFEKAVLNCPMIGVNCGKYGETMTNLISSAMILFGKGDDYIPGNHDFIPHPDLEVPPVVGETLSGIRKLYHKRLQAKQVYYQMCGATYNWTKQSMNGTRTLRKEKNAVKITTPILMFQSQNDVWVNPEMQNKIRGYNPLITLVYYPELEHEMFSSHDIYLYEYFDQVFLFLNK